MTFSRKDETLNAGVAGLLRAIEARPAERFPGGRKYMTRREIQESQIAGATTPVLVDALIKAYLDAYPKCVTVFSDNALVNLPGARLEDRSQCPSPSQRGPAPMIVYAPRRGEPISVTAPRTPPVYTWETVGPTVSHVYMGDVPNGEDAGQGVSGDSEGTQTITQQFPSNRFHPTVSGASGDPRCASCGERPPGPGGILATPARTG